MTEGSGTPAAGPQFPGAIPEIIPPAPRQSQRVYWLIGGGVFILICVGVLACVILVGLGVGKIASATAPVQSVLDSFMKDMTARDVTSAYALFSPRARQQVSLSTVEDMDQGKNFVLFDGYQHLSIKSLNLNLQANADPSLPQGTVANVQGDITYSGGFTGQFTAVLEQVKGSWMLDQINITVPPSKLQP